MNERDLIDEAALRRALRLEPHEHAPRLDTATLVAAARAEERPLLTIVVGFAGVIVIAVASGLVWSTILGEVFAAVITVADLLEQPVVPASVLAATAVAILYEIGQRRGRTDAIAS